MIDAQRALADYLALEPATFDVLDRFTLHQHEIWTDIASSKYILSLEFWYGTGIADDARCLHLVFEEVQELHFETAGGYLALPLAIRVLQQDQWEHLRYQVIVSGDQNLSFYSRSLQAEILEN